MAIPDNDNNNTNTNNNNNDDDDEDDEDDNNNNKLTLGICAQLIFGQKIPLSPHFFVRFILLWKL